jgi:hypothetical protein
MDAKPPELPASLPQDLRDFVECRSMSVTIQDGPQAWVQLPDGVKGYLPADAAPDLTIVPGSTPETMTIKVSLGFFSLSLPAAVNAGRLSIDTRKLPWMAPASIATGIAGFVDTLNRWYEANGKGLAAPTFGAGGVTLRLVDMPAA